MLSDALMNMALVRLDRPPRQPARAVTDAVRKAILAEAHRRGLNAPAVLSCHAEADYLGDARGVVEDVERRYQLAPGAVVERVKRRIVQADVLAILAADDESQVVFADVNAGLILLELPETEFLTVVEHAILIGCTSGRFGQAEARALFEYADATLRSHGTPYRGDHDEWQFEWVGDPKQHELTVEPALLALADVRLQGGPHDDFERALRKRRLGATKDLEDAMIAAARSVESVLKVLYDEHEIETPSKHELAGLFNGLAHKDVAVLPGYVSNLVLAPGGPRNHMAGHGPGADVREVPEELADASIAAAATAITFLAHYLP